jgi:hypothetical protein
VTNVLSKVNNGFTDAAIAGLAAKEDFTNVVLKRSESSNSYRGEFMLFTDVMLIQVKGTYNHITGKAQLRIIFSNVCIDLLKDAGTVSRG